MTDSLNILIPRQFSADFEENLQNLQEIGKLCTTKFESDLKDGEEVKITMPGKVTMADWNGGDLNEVETITATSVTVKINQGKQVNFELQKAKEIQIANAGSTAPKLIKEYSSDGLYQFRDAIDKSAGLILAANAGYTIGTASSPQAITKDTLISYLAKMKTKFTRGTANGTAYMAGKMLAVLPPEMIELLTQSGTFQYTESGFTNLKDGSVAKIAGWEIVQSNNTPVSGSTYYALFGVKGESGAIATQKSIDLIPYIREKSLNKAFKGGGLFGTAGHRSDKTGALICTLS